MRHRVGDKKPEQNRPQHVLDVGQSQVVRSPIGRDRALDHFSRVANGHEQPEPRQKAQAALEDAFAGKAERVRLNLPCANSSLGVGDYAAATTEHA